MMMMMKLDGFLEPWIYNSGNERSVYFAAAQNAHK